MDMGAVTDLRYINSAISTARMVMAHSLHSSLGGLQATSFAVEMGAKLRNLSTPTSSDMYYAWCAAHPSHPIIPSSPQGETSLSKGHTSLMVTAGVLICSMQEAATGTEASARANNSYSVQHESRLAC